MKETTKYQPQHDEQRVHFSLRRSLGLLDQPRGDALTQLATAISDTVSLRTTRVQFDELNCEDGELRISDVSRSIRCRFAMPFGFGNIKSEDGKEETREDHVRAAFNSPFRPFVLASTSVGQEGLDFHQYCHRVYHWNLPSNPVDLEQREGRVHRYKGHVVRKNVAKAYGSEALHGCSPTAHPWNVLFCLAKKDRPSDANDLVPYWIFETPGGAKIERMVPILPLSRDRQKLARLKDSLAVYRLAFGQPRQEELIAHLRAHQSDAQSELLASSTINLAPATDD